MKWSAQLGLQTAFGVILAVVMALRLGLDDPWWSAMSAWVVANPDRTAMFAKALQRVLGTVLGLLTGLLLASLGNARPLLLLLGLACIGAICSRQRYLARYPYAWILGSMTALMVLVQAATGPNGLFSFAMNRASEILVGVAAATVVGLIALAGKTPKDAPAPPKVDAEEVRAVTVCGAIVIVTCLLAWQILNLPQPVQMAVSALVVLDRDVGTLRHRGKQRVLGCALGSVYALIAMAIAGDSMLLWLGGLGIGIFLFSSLHQGGGPLAYVGTQGGIAVIIALVTGRTPPESMLPAIDRLSGAMLGVIVVVIVSAIVASLLYRDREPVAARAA